MSQNILIVDFGMGNLNSVRKKISQLGINVLVSNNHKDFAKADKLILPGVGHFKMAVYNLNKLNLWDSLNKHILQAKKPVLGICLGMQLMAKHSEEGDVEGLGWFDTAIVKFNIENTLKFKIPHTGWNQIIKRKESQLFNNIPDYSEFYFVHSYHFVCKQPQLVLTETQYEYLFTSSIESNNIFGVQFHPEKSHKIGEQLLKNFINI